MTRARASFEPGSGIRHGDEAERPNAERQQERVASNGGLGDAQGDLRITAKRRVRIVPIGRRGSTIDMTLLTDPEIDRIGPGPGYLSAACHRCSGQIEGVHVGGPNQSERAGGKERKRL